VTAAWSRDAEAAFTAEWQALEPAVRAIARRDIDIWRRAAGDEDDVCQEAALAICQRAAEGTRISNYRGFTCKVVHNHRVDVLRKRRPETVELSPTLTDGIDSDVAVVRLGETIPSPADGPWTRRLTWLQRRVLELGAEDGLTRAEIARRLLLTERQVKRARERASGELRVELEEGRDP
jgi:DNA-directed RNA polymerase specialized sigma24 family protein